MNISKNGIEFIKRWEGFRGTAYQCPSGVWTIGFGHTKCVIEGMTCTMEMAENWLLEDLKKAENAVNLWSGTYGFTQHQYDALVSFTFNCGSGNLYKLLGGGMRTIEVISEKIIEYNKSNGKALAGLTRRRVEEQNMIRRDFTLPIYYPIYEGDSPYIDEVFKAVGATNQYDIAQEAPWKRRRPIAIANGYPYYTGKAEQNRCLISLAKQGRLVRP